MHLRTLQRALSLDMQPTLDDGPRRLAPFQNFRPPADADVATEIYYEQLMLGLQELKSLLTVHGSRNALCFPTEYLGADRFHSMPATSADLLGLILAGQTRLLKPHRILLTQLLLGVYQFTHSPSAPPFQQLSVAALGPLHEWDKRLAAFAHFTFGDFMAIEPGMKSVLQDERPVYLAIGDLEPNGVFKRGPWLLTQAPQEASFSSVTLKQEQEGRVTLTACAGEHGVRLQNALAGAPWVMMAPVMLESDTSAGARDAEKNLADYCGQLLSSIDSRNLPIRLSVDDKGRVCRLSFLVTPSIRDRVMCHHLLPQRRQQAIFLIQALLSYLVEEGCLDEARVLKDKACAMLGPVLEWDNRLAVFELLARDDLQALDPRLPFWLEKGREVFLAPTGYFKANVTTQGVLKRPLQAALIPPVHRETPFVGLKLEGKNFRTDVIRMTRLGGTLSPMMARMVLRSGWIKGAG